MMPRYLVRRLEVPPAAPGSLIIGAHAGTDICWPDEQAVLCRGALVASRAGTSSSPGSGLSVLSQAAQHEFDGAKHAAFSGIDGRPNRAVRTDASGPAGPIAVEFVLRDEFQRQLAQRQIR